MPGLVLLTERIKGPKQARSVSIYTSSYALGSAGSFLVAELTRRQFTFAGIFTVIAVAGLIACVALLIKQAVHPVDAATAPADPSIAGH